MFSEFQTNVTKEWENVKKQLPGPKHGHGQGISDISIFIKGDSVKQQLKLFISNLHTEPETNSS